MSSDEVGKLLQQLNPRKAIGDDKIPPALIKIAPVGILNTFSKIYEKFSKNFLISKIEMFLSPLLAAYRKS